ncbi:hypothetical protein D3C76_1579490 [compost metagenome]
MSESLRHRAGRLVPALVIVAEHRGRFQRGLQIAWLQPVQALLGMVRPDARQAVGLQFGAHFQAVVTGGRLADRQGFVEGPG